MVIHEKKKITLCDCKDECPAHPRDRMIHIGDKCYHEDGTSHLIKRRNNIN